VYETHLESKEKYVLELSKQNKKQKSTSCNISDTFSALALFRLDVGAKVIIFLNKQSRSLRA